MTDLTRRDFGQALLAGGLLSHLPRAERGLAARGARERGIAHRRAGHSRRALHRSAAPDRVHGDPLRSRRGRGRRLRHLGARRSGGRDAAAREPGRRDPRAVPDRRRAVRPACLRRCDPLSRGTQGRLRLGHARPPHPARGRGGDRRPRRRRPARQARRGGRLQGVRGRFHRTGGRRQRRRGRGCDGGKDASEPRLRRDEGRSRHREPQSRRRRRVRARGRERRRRHPRLAKRTHRRGCAPAVGRLRRLRRGHEAGAWRRGARTWDWTTRRCAARRSSWSPRT